MGFSTLGEGLILKRTATKKNVNSGIIAHKAEATTNLFNMSKLFLKELPEPLKPDTRASNAQEIIFDNREGTGLNSKIKCMTAGGEGIGRSDTFQNLHLSELAFWPHAKEILDGLLQAVPNTPDSMVIVESTANGYDYFKEFWDKACAGESDFEPLFCAWWELEEYRMPVPEDFVLSEEEKEIKALYGLDDEQMTWRRWCLRNNCGGDINTFKQEYPACPEEAFLASGECIFDKDKLIAQIAKCRNKSARKGEFVYKKTISPVKNALGEVVAVDKHITDIVFVEKENGLITLHQEPQTKKDASGQVIAKRSYSIGGDTAGLGLDYYTAKVVGNDNLETVATLRKQRIDEDKYADQVYCLGKFYHDALIGIETNFSLVPMRELNDLNYPNLYMRERLDSTLNEVQRVAGFNTTRQTKQVILQGLVTDFRDNPDIECDVETLQEMLTFVRKENGKQEAQEGYHDDLVMAKAIADFVATSQGDANWQKVEKIKTYKNAVDKFFSSDDWWDEEEGGYLEW
ncbi:MAG: hypothetical protein IKK20_02465 [Clostridia bacterium]|nr:hypothetical protein [Clostridia bacterium]